MSRWAEGVICTFLGNLLKAVEPGQIFIKDFVQLDDKIDIAVGSDVRAIPIRPLQKYLEVSAVQERVVGFKCITDGSMSSD